MRQELVATAESGFNNEEKAKSSMCRAVVIEIMELGLLEKNNTADSVILGL